jgi:uncharacterized protein YaaW (UPF0174 family)
MNEKIFNIRNSEYKKRIKEILTSNDKEISDNLKKFSNDILNFKINENKIMQKCLQELEKKKINNSSTLFENEYKKLYLELFKKKYTNKLEKLKIKHNLIEKDISKLNEFTIHKHIEQQKILQFNKNVLNKGAISILESLKFKKGCKYNKNLRIYLENPIPYLLK